MKSVRVMCFLALYKPHATARGLQPPACCGYPAMWWMAKRLHRCVSARMVAKWTS